MTTTRWLVAGAGGGDLKASWRFVARMERSEIRGHPIRHILLNLKKYFRYLRDNPGINWKIKRGGLLAGALADHSVLEPQRFRFAWLEVPAKRRVKCASITMTAWG